MPCETALALERTDFVHIHGERFWCLVNDIKMITSTESELVVPANSRNARAFRYACFSVLKSESMNFSTTERCICHLPAFRRT